MEANHHAARRRERRRGSALVNNVGDALKLSQRLAAAGKLCAADHAARLAERHAKVAERLVNLKGQLRRIWQARVDAERDFVTSCEKRETDLRRREVSLRHAERALATQELYSAPVDRYPDR